jgi:hypothetical protein
VEAVMRALTILMILAALRAAGTAAPAPTTRAAGGRTGASPAARAAPAAGANADPAGPMDPMDPADPADPFDAELAGPRGPVIGPPIGTVLAHAYATAGLDHDPGDRWRTRARLAGLVPWVTVRTARDASWQDAHAEVGHGTSLEVRATWRLDRLLFDSHELQISGIEAARRRERRRLATRVIRAYFTWRRAAGAALPASDDREILRLAEATAELDALTDGWFSGDVARRQRGPTEPR